MEKFIIEWNTKVNGEWKKGYHQTIKESENNQAMNVYVEHVCTDKKEAKVFYEKGEAEKVADLFRSPFHLPEILFKL